MHKMSTGDGCVSDLALDEWLASELDAEAGAQVERHVAGCARCSARRAERDADRSAFLRAAPSFTALAAKRQTRPQESPPRRARTVPLAIGAGALALAAAALLLLRSPVHDDREDTRAKGSVHLGYFLKRGERVTRGRPSDPLHPGDALRFTYTTPRPAYLAVIDVDARSASVYFPSRATEATQVHAGNDVALDFRVDLDDQLGTERIYGVFCARSFVLEPVRTALKADGRLPALPDCEVDVITLRKEAAR
jgi:putative zinc finger protein